MDNTDLIDKQGWFTNTKDPDEYETAEVKQIIKLMNQARKDERIQIFEMITEVVDLKHKESKSCYDCFQCAQKNAAEKIIARIEDRGI